MNRRRNIIIIVVVLAAVIGLGAVATRPHSDALTARVVKVAYT
ncbi:MAG: hypothetical protein QOF71_2764, partial [Candidatus Eremiobacteraeota bacterium]|nr:hypothetical protein [Candidatus Eremiobacteraeota bacterium]